MNAKQLLFLAVLTMTMGCAHQTIHEYCTGHADKYRDYDQCYAECSASNTCTDRGRKGAGAFLTGFSQGMKQNKSHSTNCVTSKTDTGAGTQAYTTCN